MPPTTTWRPGIATSSCLCGVHCEDHLKLPGSHDRRPLPLQWGRLYLKSGIYQYLGTLPKLNIAHQKSLLKMIFLLPRWDMLVPWRVNVPHFFLLNSICWGEKVKSFHISAPNYTNAGRKVSINHHLLSGSPALVSLLQSSLKF